MIAEATLNRHEQAADFAARREKLLDLIAR
jgi:hypothetical protein